LSSITVPLVFQSQTLTEINKMIVHTKIRHPRSSDLVLMVTSPSGTVVELSRNNAGSVSDSFDGTSWQDNDSGQVPSVTEFVYVNAEYASPLAPLDELSLFTGENPNGEWKLTITDSESGIYGELWEWGLEFVAGNPCSPNPCQNGGSCVSFLNRFTCTCPVNWGGTLCELAPCTTTKCVSPANLNLSFGDSSTVVEHTILLINQEKPVQQIRVWVSITHQYSGDIIIILQSPTGTGLVLTDFFGYDFPNAFNDAAFYDGADIPVANYTFTVSNIAAGGMELGPLDPLRNMTGEFANGFWTLHVYDNKGDDSGVLQQWSFEFDNVDHCVSSPCLNNGICQNDFNKASCICADGFTGPLCETQLGSNTPSAQPYNPPSEPTVITKPLQNTARILITIIGVVVGSVVLVAIVIAVMVGVRRRRRFSRMRGGSVSIELQ
jgi:subtilisin-like proprotein convertase family protein